MKTVSNTEVAQRLALWAGDKTIQASFQEYFRAIGVLAADEQLEGDSYLFENFVSEAEAA
jgi:hypothetical protein